jgi:hypothetical protein
MCSEYDHLRCASIQRSVSCPKCTVGVTNEDEPRLGSVAKVVRLTHYLHLGDGVQILKFVISIFKYKLTSR